VVVDSTHSAVYTTGYVERGFSGLLGGLWALLFGSNTASDGYLVKQDLNGAVQWQIVLGGSGDDACTGVCVDAAGNAYVTGYFSGSNASFTGASGTNQTMSSAGGRDIFVVCYNASGAPQWKLKAGAGGDDQGNSIQQANGKLIIGGSFNGSPTIAGMATSAAATAVNNRTHGFIAALQASTGSAIWRVDGTNGENSAINTVASDGSSVFALGVHKGTSYNFQNSSGSLNTNLSTIGGNLSADILALGMDGSFKWTQAVANPGSDEINALGLASSATAVYISGSSHNNSVFPGSVTVAGPGNPHDYGYVARLDKNSGATMWTLPFSGVTDHAQVGRTLATDIHGDLVIAGTYKNNLTLPDGSQLTGANDLQVFVAKLSGSGNLKWAMTPSGEKDDMPNGVALDGAGGVYLAGSYEKDITFDAVYSDHSSQNLFIAKLHDLDFDVAALRDPTEFNAPHSLCESDAPVNLTGWLVPEEMGTGKTIFSSTGVTGPEGALGLLPGGTAMLDNVSDQIVIDLGDTIPAGESVILHWRSMGGTAIINVQGSLAGASAFTDFGNKTTSSTTVVLTQVTATAPMRYLKLNGGGSNACQVDGVFYDFGSNTDGSWSGTSVSGSTFNPAGLSGNVNITYTSYGHTTTHTVAVSPVPIAGSLAGGYICPGTSFTATLQGQSGGSIAWEASTNAGSTWSAVGSNSATITLPSVTLTTLLKATATSPPCPASMSNTVTVTPGDTTPPILDPCPANIVVNVQNSGSCGAIVTYAAPQAHNSCGAALTVARTSGLASGSTFPFGTTTVAHSTTQATHTATCSFTVTVNDQAPPTFSVAATPTLYLNASGHAAIPDLYALLSGVTDCSGVGAHSQSPVVGSLVNSNTAVTLHVTDILSNDTSILRNLPVVDTIRPTITCASVAPIEMTLGQCGVSVTIPEPVFADNTGWTALDSAGSIYSGSLFPVGSHTVTYTVTDPSGLTASCASTVVITVASVPPLAYPAGIICRTSAAVNPVSSHPAGGQFQSDVAGLALNNTTGAIDPQSSDPGTYQVTLLYAGPCPVSTSTSVVIEAPVNAGANATLTVCSTDASLPLLPLLGPNADAGGAWTLSGSPASNILNPAVNSSGTYIYTVTGGPACGNAQANVAVTVHTTPSPAWTAPAPICSTSSSINMNGTITGTTGGAWFGPGISGHSFDPASVTETGNSSTYTLNYSVTVSGCTASQSGDITVVTKPVPFAGGYTSDIICPGTSFTATLEGDYGGTVVWKKSTNGGSTWSTTGSNSTSITLPSVTLTTLLKANVTSSPCPAAVSNIITVTPGDTTPPILDPCPANIVVNVQNSNNCGATITYTAPLAHSSCGDDLTVTRTNGLASGSIFPFGTTTVTHSTTQATHTATCSFTVTVNDMAPPTFSTGAAPTLYLNSYGQAAVPDLYALLSDVTDCSGVGAHSQTPAAGTLVYSEAEVTLHVADVLNNDTSITFALPVMDSIPPTISCANVGPVEMVLGQCGVNVVIPVPAHADNTGITTLDSSGSIYSGSLFPVGMHTVTYTVTDPSGLTASCTSTVEVTVASVPPLEYPSDLICQNSATIDPVNTFPAGGQFQTDVAGLTLNDVTGAIDPQTSAPGTYQVTLLYDGPCPVSTSTSVAIEAPVHAGADAALAVCSTDDAFSLFSVLGTNADTGGAWTLDDNSTDSIFNPATDVSGTYTYTVMGGPACGNASATVVMTVNAMPSAAWNSPAPICSASSPIDMSNAVTGTSGGTWAGTGIAPGSDSFDPALIVPQGNSNTYTLSYTVTINGCTASQDGDITVVTSPVAVAGADASVCALDRQMAAGLSLGTGVWSAPAGITVTDMQDPNATAHANGPGAYALLWTATNGQCSDIDTVLITYDIPSEITAFSAGEDQEQNIIQAVQLEGMADGATEVHWSFLIGSGQILQPGQAATEVHNLAIGTNALMLTARVGVCPYETDTVMITIHDLFIPSGFSPNGDGVNDTFSVTGLDVLTDNELTVFDRWGQQVYHMKGYANQWDGHGENSDKELSDGTYFYVLNFTSGQNYHGTIIIKR